MIPAAQASPSIVTNFRGKTWSFRSREHQAEVLAAVSTWQAVVLSMFGYGLLCNLLRYRRMKQKHDQYPYNTRDSFSKMTTQHAYEIQKYLYDVEFPFTTQKALEFALFR